MRLLFLSVSRADLRLYLKARKQTGARMPPIATPLKCVRVFARTCFLAQKNFSHGSLSTWPCLFHARQDDTLLQHLAQERLRASLEMIPGGARIRITDLLPSNPLEYPRLQIGEQAAEQDASAGLSGRLVRLIVSRVKGANVKPADERPSGGEFTALHVAQVLELARHGRTGSSLPLPGNLEVQRHRDALVFCAKEGTALSPRDYEYKIDSLPELNAIRIPELGCFPLPQ